MRCLLCLLLPTLLPAVEPVMFRADAAHSGVYSSPSPTLSALRWKFHTNGKIFSSPAVTADTVYFGSSDRYLYAVNAADGTLRWKFPTGLGVTSSPAVSDGLVYVNSLDGNFYAVDTATGKLRWKFSTAGERRFTARGIHGIAPPTETMPDPYDVFLSSPALAGGLVYFGSGDTHVYALDARTGALRWKFATGDVVHATPAISAGVLYIGSWDRYLYALDAETGAPLWKFQTGDDPDIHNQIGIASSATVSNGTVLFGCRDGHFYALDAKTGRQRWAEDNKTSWVISSPAVTDGVVYFPTAAGMQVKAIEIATGKARWSVPTKAISFSSPALTGLHLFFGAQDGWLRRLDRATGEITASFQTEGSRQNSARYLDPEGKPSMAALFVDPTLDGVILSLDRLYSLGNIASSPVLANGAVYFGSTDGNLYAVN